MTFYIFCAIIPISCRVTEKMEKLTVYVDRIESLSPGSGERTAVLLFRMEAGVYQEWQVPLHLLPEGTQEGDVLRLFFEVDQEEKAALKEQIVSLMSDLFDEPQAEGETKG